MRGIRAGTLALLAVLLALPMTSYAWNSAVLDVGNPPANTTPLITVTLVYTDTTTFKTTKIIYQPTGGTVEIDKGNVGLDESDHTAHIALTIPASLFELDATMHGSGLAVNRTTKVTASLDPATGQDPLFNFTDGINQMGPVDIIATAAEGSYTEVPVTGNPGIVTVRLSMKFTIMGTVRPGNFPARITVQVNASNIPTL